jgi:hypothetical protein
MSMAVAAGFFGDHSSVTSPAVDAASSAEDVDVSAGDTHL